MVDPLAEKYHFNSSFAYCNNSPINNIDPNGCSTFVVNNGGGTYRVVGGDLEDNDLNIYVISFGKNGIEKKSMGQTTSITSFYNSDANNGKGAWAIGCIIDTNDKSGETFLNGITENTPSLDFYMENATGGELYDFKRTNGQANNTTDLDPYRGMPISTGLYSSARDVGNYAAGYMAGIYGFSWKNTRKAFDELQSLQTGRNSIEGISSQNAQYLGWKHGSVDYAFKLKPIVLWSKSLPGLINKHILNK